MLERLDKYNNRFSRHDPLPPEVEDTKVEALIKEFKDWNPLQQRHTAIL